MPAFAYTSGNIANLTAGGPASMTDIQGPFTDVRTALNGQLDEINVPNLSAAFTTYKRIQRGVAQISSAATANSYGLWLGSIDAANRLTIGMSAGGGVFYLNPSFYNANSRVTKLNLRLTAIPNAVAPAITFTAGLYPVSTYGGASGAGPTIASVGTIVSGSSTPIASPSAAALTTATSGDFNFPAAGGYTLIVITNGTPAAGSLTELNAYLEMRQV